MINKFRLLEVAEIAKNIANQSKCERLKVGAIVLSSYGRIMGMGHNDIYLDDEYCDNDYIENGHCTLSTHAELIAILNAKECTEIPYAIVVTHKPCLECLKVIIAADIDFVYYINETNYKETRNYNILSEYVNIIKLGGNNNEN